MMTKNKTQRKKENLILFKGRSNKLLMKRFGEHNYTYVSQNAYVASCLQSGIVVGYCAGRTTVKVYADRNREEKIAEFRVIVLPTHKHQLPLYVNRWNGVPQDKIPDDIIEIPAGTKNYNIKKSVRICKVVADAYEKMASDANSMGIYFKVSYGYRSYDEQKQIINRLIKQNGKEDAIKRAAPAGFSEHHTGLAMDVGGMIKEDGTFVTTNNDAYRWLAENCYKYGFMIKNLKGKEHITGTIYEPWHIRYIGDLAITKKLHDFSLTLDEYIEMQICSKK